MLLLLTLACTLTSTAPSVAGGDTETCVVESDRSCLGQPTLAAASELPQKVDTNVLGEPLQTCGLEPVTGWHRDGACRTDASDRGVHVVCAAMTSTFLDYTRARGNDLSSPSPRHGFPGLKPGDRWCLCAARWAEAAAANAAPPVVLEATHARALDIVELQRLQALQLEL